MHSQEAHSMMVKPLALPSHNFLWLPVGPLLPMGVSHPRVLDPLTYRCWSPALPLSPCLSS